MLTEILLILLYTLILSVLIYRHRIFSLPGISKLWIILAFILKIGAGAALGLIYSHHYTDRLKADTFKFFDDSGVMIEALAINPKHFFELLTGIGLDDPELETYFYKMNTWMTEDFYITSNRMMIRLNVLFRFLTPPGEHYYLHVVLINFLSLLGLIFMCKAFFVKLERHHTIFFLVLVLFPSILFWGSGLLKDGIIIFALGSLMYSFSRMLNGYKHKILGGFVFFVSALLLALIKIYILFTLIPALIAWIWCSVKPKNVVRKFILAHFACFLIIAAVHFTFPKVDSVRYLTEKQSEFFQVVEREKPNHILSIIPLNNSLVIIAYQSVPAFFRVLLRPHIFESSEPLVFISALENLIILLFIFLIVFTSRRGTWSHSPMFYFSLSFFILIFMLIGLIVPVTGAIVRYKIVALPFLIYMLFQLFDNSLPDKILKRLQS